MRSGTSANAAALEIEIVGVIDHQPGVRTVRQRSQLVQWRTVAVHGEHAFGDDQRALVMGSVLPEQIGDMAGIVVAERPALRRGTAVRRSTARMRQLVDQDQIASAGHTGAMPALAR